MFILFGLFFGTACIEDINRTAQEFPDNPRDDYDNDGLSEFDGDCDDLNTNIMGPSLWYADADGDGFGNPLTEVEACQSVLLDLDEIYVSEGTDCDDDNPEVHPDIDEGCDGVDNDCNGEIDDYNGSNAPRWFNDADGDGFGTPEVSIHACDQPASYVVDNTDCDDSNADTYPNAREYCDGIDTNCNGVLDDNSAVDVLQWYSDQDGDGFGYPTTVIFQCTQPSGFVLDNTDCNDLSNKQYPGADELCNQQDDNCNGQFDEGVLLDFFMDSDSDGYGDANQIIEACSVPGGASENSDDCNDGSALVRPGATEFCNNIDDNCDGYIDNNAVGTSEYYPDADDDGHGVQSNPLISCPSFDPVTGLPVAPVGYSLFDDDCDDADASRSPSQPELCTETIDENCDGHNTIGATDVQSYIADSDGDGFGNDAFVLDFCYAPLGYVSYDPTDAVDCNDNDSEVNPSVPASAEICNGRLDSCDNQWDGISPPIEEIDEDGDGFVACVLDVPLAGWLGDSITEGADCDLLDAAVFPGNLPLESDPEGCHLDSDNDGFGDINPPDLGAIVSVDPGTDCMDSENWVYPGAPEDCNGVAEDCSDPLYPVPAQESDDDGDGYVECGGYDALTWEGDVSVVGGDDCNDDRPNAEFTYPGATGDPNVCAQDADGDGLSDCVFSSTNTVQPAPSTYFCDIGVFLSGDVGPDFVLIPAGTDPLGRYTLTRDFYLMTTEVSAAMWDAVMGSGSSTALTAKASVSWHDAALFANTLSALMGKAECYSCSGSHPNQVCSETVNPYECSGYVLPTEAEWEYAARSGTTSDFWTGDGSSLGGAYSAEACNGTETIQDGVSNPLIGDYAWYCGNNSPTGVKSVAQKLPNGFGLYDMHGNLYEWTTDWIGCSFPQASTDPYCGSTGSSRVIRGGSWNYDTYYMRASYRSNFDPTYRYYYIGFRLGLHP